MKMIVLKILPFWTLLCTVAAFTITYSNVDPLMQWTEVFPNNFVKDMRFGDEQYVLALLRWKNPTETYELTVRTHTFNAFIHTKVCNVSSPFENTSDWVVAESITLLKSNRSVLVYWKETNKTEGNRAKLQIILTDTCRSSPYIYVKAASNKAADYTIVKFEQTFEVIFRNDESRPAFVKLAFDFYGTQLIDNPEPIFVDSIDGLGLLSIEKVYAMNLTKMQDYVLIGDKEDFTLGVYKDVYSPISGWLKADGIHSFAHAYSNSSGYATICWQMLQFEIRCKALDEIPEFAKEPEDFLMIPVDRYFDFHTFSIYNKPDGELLFVHGAYNGKHLIVVEKPLKSGMCRRVAMVEIPYPLYKVEVIYIGDSEWCLAYIARGQKTEYSDIYEFSGGCFLEFFYQEVTPCGTPALKRGREISVISLLPT